MSFTQKYCVVYFFTPTDDGAVFSATEWPLHCTLAGVFALDWTPELRKEFRDLITRQSSVKSQITSEEFFGADSSVHVKLVKPVTALRDLHTSIANFIESHGGTFNEPLYTRAGYRPHITLTSRNPALPSMPTSITSVSIVDMFPEHNHTMRRIMETIKLKTELLAASSQTPRKRKDL